MPAGGTQNAHYPVNSRSASNTWPGKTYIHNGEDNRPTVSGVFDQFFSLYQQRASGSASADQTLNDFEDDAQKTNYVVKTVREETVRHIESKDGSSPFFMYVAAPAMRTQGMASDAQRQTVFDLEENKIDTCDHIDDVNQPYPSGTSIQALKALVEQNGQSWSTARSYLFNELCTASKKTERFNVHAFASTVDTLMNATIDALYRKNLWQNTLILLTSDNGGQPYTQTFNWPLRGAWFVPPNTKLHPHIKLVVCVCSQAGRTRIWKAASVFTPPWEVGFYQVLSEVV
jgi:arylsulfatase A-like enzyme